MAMRILADENIPQAMEAFSPFGAVELAPGRSITPGMVRGADALVVRSVTRVDASLVGDTPLRFVGTATIGVDHVDRSFLDGRGIAFASAAGCNADGVVQYVVSALAVLAGRMDFALDGLAVGVVGCGAIGGRLLDRLPALGIRCLASDPPRERAGDRLPSAPLIDLLEACDVVTLHTPWTTGGPDPTHHLVGARELRHLGKGGILVNASRGPVVDNGALREALETGRIAAAVLDVFEGEPRPDQCLVDLADIATPHIAGYSAEGKLNGTRMMHEAMARVLGKQPCWQPELPPAQPATIDWIRGIAPFDAFRRTLAAACPLEDDDELLRDGLGKDDARWGEHFDGLRKGYRTRREFTAFTVRGVPERGGWREALRALGFAVA